MRILFTRFPLESALGGAEIQTLSLMKGLNDRGHAVAFLGSCPVILEETAKLRLPHAKLEIGPPPVTKWGTVSFAWRKKKMQERLEAALDNFVMVRRAHHDAVTLSPTKGRDVDTIIMLSLSEKLLLTEAAVKRGMKVLWLEHDRVGRWLTKNPWLPTLRSLSENVTTVCVSELSRKIYLDLGWKPENVIAIPNGIDMNRFAECHPERSRRMTGEGDGSTTLTVTPSLNIGCVARLSQEKGVDVLIQSIGDLPQVRLTIVGLGPDEGYIRKIAQQPHEREMVNDDRIKILPHVKDLGEFYRSIDVLVLPSRENDPFGLVAAEAMSIGVPVIVTDQCGIAGYLRDGLDAVIVKANDEEALRAGIIKMLDADLRAKIAEHGKQTAQEKFSVERMIEAYEKVILQT